MYGQKNVVVAGENTDEQFGFSLDHLKIHDYYCTPFSAKSVTKNRAKLSKRFIKI